MSKSSIEWTEQTWNPIVGCSIVSPGCSNCYAMTMAARIEAMNEGLPAGHRPGGEYIGTTKKVNGKAVWTGKLALADEQKLLAPLRRKKATTYFVNSMGDLFHEDAPDEWIDKVFAVMALSPQHIFQVLTKRSARMRNYVNGVRARLYRQTIKGNDYVILNTETARHSSTQIGGRKPWPLPNVWLGVSTEDQRRADERIPDLLATPAAIRFISAEPLLGPTDLTRIMREGNRQVYVDNALDGFISNGHGGSYGPKLDWVIVGGESGPDARPMHPDWARSLRDQCEVAGVLFFFKQWGAFLPVGQTLPGYGKVTGGTAVRPGRLKLHCGENRERGPQHAFAERGVESAALPDDRLTFRVGKSAAGRLLDGVEYNGMPEAVR